VSRGFSQQEGEDYDETLIKEIVPVFMKISRTTMIMRFRGRNPYI
jgi:hypothetical protein